MKRNEFVIDLTNRPIVDSIQGKATALDYLYNDILAGFELLQNADTSQQKHFAAKYLVVELLLFKDACRSLRDDINKLVKSVNETYRSAGRAEVLLFVKVDEQVLKQVEQDLRDARKKICAHFFTDSEGRYVTLGEVLTRLLPAVSEGKLHGHLRKLEQDVYFRLKAWLANDTNTQFLVL